MDRELAARILGRLPGFRAAVLGDYCLDKYIHFNPALNEISRETGETAYQVTRVRTFPGAAGTVCANLTALGFGVVDCYGVIGGDGEGFELARELGRIGCGVKNLLASDRLTNTYLKPVDTDLREASRYDYRTRAPVPDALCDELFLRLEAELKNYNAVLIIDQFDLPDDRLISERMLKKLSVMAEKKPSVLFYADSRARAGDFKKMTVKCNHREAAAVARLSPENDNLPETGRHLIALTGAPAFVTVGERGVVSVSEGGAVLSPAVAVAGPVDIVGAGDSASSGIVAALCSGYSMEEAAFFANVAASVTIKKIGVTGTASPEEILTNAAVYEGIAARRLA